jgi:hypothetical protein
MLPLLLAAAAHADAGSKTAFYLFAGSFAVWAVAIGAIGVLRPAFPGGSTGQRAVMLVSFVLMAGAMSSAVLTAN